MVHLRKHSNLPALCGLLLLASGPAWAQTPPQTRPGAPAAGAPAKVKQPFVFSIPTLKYAEEIPVNFPIPAYTSNVTKKRFISSVKGTPSASAMIQTRDQIDMVFNWYKDICKRDNWDFRTPTAEGSTKLSSTHSRIYMIEGKKEKQMIMIFCNPDKKTGGTTVNISWSKTKK
ncbi:MAG: hypothetical protein JSS86_17590 [Cyanobacteria bacterium SZAS LIN-2]|nr:hypothetical protein [Cyanobacteria bacterium SZAS LIN-2]